MLVFMWQRKITTYSCHIKIALAGFDSVLMLLGEVKYFVKNVFVKNVLVILNRLRETTACDFLQQFMLT